MNMLQGRHVEWEDDFGEKKEGTLVDLYASASEGIYAVVYSEDGRLSQVGIWELKVVMNPPVDKGY